MTNLEKTEEIELGEELNFEITDEDRKNFKRLDQFLAEKIPGHSRTFLKNLFLNDQIVLSEESKIQNIKIELKKMPPIGTLVSVLIPPPMPADAIAENIPLEILYEDEHLLFINKPQGLVTHPAPGNYTGTLVNAILYHCKDLQGVGDQKRPGIVHRLDKGTSGVMVVAKNQACHEGLVLLFSTHNLERHYEAIIMSTHLESHGKIESLIGRDPHNRLRMKANVNHGKKAITHFKMIKQYTHHAHIDFKLETGRTHQIRVHASEILKRPILCDPTYGNPHDQLVKMGTEFQNIIRDYPYPFLHAKSLGLVHPITGEKLHFEVPPPKIFQDVLNLSEKK
jgi:23S rRNA pseudouridine1911/1915/1917 synthase